MIVSALSEIQDRYGYLPREELEFLALRTGTSLYRIQEVSTFFPHFRLEPPPEATVQVCQSMSCHLRGAGELLAATRARFQDDIKRRKLEIQGVSCLGRCDIAPVACVRGRKAGEMRFEDRYYGDLKTERLEELTATALNRRDLPEAHSLRDAPPDERPLWQIDLYDPRHGGSCPEPYAAVRGILAEAREGEPIADASADKVINALTFAGLVGMGGAAARTGKKWDDVKRAKNDVKYVVCNGDESEPGTFKDRELLYHAPHLVIEGILVAGLILNAKRGYIYIRHEYEEQIEAVRHALVDALRQAPEAFARCPLEVFVSPGLYICGEESALLEVIEGRRAQPRNTPPEIRTNGLFDRPTVVNNVETYAWVPSILLRDLPLDVYDPGHGGECPRPYAAVRQVHADVDRAREAAAQEVIDTIVVAGRSGVAGPDADWGKKWAGLKQALGKPDAKFASVVCTRHESEARIERDRELLARSPHLVVEGVFVAGLLLNAQSYICIRHDWKEEIEAIRRALGDAERNMPEALKHCPLELLVGPAELTANSPQFLQAGTPFGQPAFCDTIESFARLPSILFRYWRPGMRFFSVSGDVSRPGVFEVSVQTTLGQLVERAGGMSQGLTLRAAAMSGPSGGFIPRYLKAADLRRAVERNLSGLRERAPHEARRVEAFARRALAANAERLDILELELDVALFRTLGLALGAGIVLYGGRPDNNKPMLDQALNCLEFFHKESCGKCVPCRLGCEQLVGFANRLRSASEPDDAHGVEPAVRTLAEVMETTSICGLGRVAFKPLLTVLDYFADELKESRLP